VAIRRRGRPGRRPKTFSRWLRITLLANGVSLPLPREDALDAAWTLVATGRAIDPRLWVEALACKGIRERESSLPHNL
jgi:hypothetical protein